MSERLGMMTNAEDEFLLRRVREAAEERTSSVFVEIGVDRARTARRMALTLAEARRDFLLVGIDVRPACLRHWLERMNDWHERGRALYFGCPSQVVGHLLFGRVALVFVDGCHCRQCVAADIAAWESKIESGGFMLFHDTKIDGRAATGRIDTEVWHGEHRPNGAIAAIESSVVAGWPLVGEVKSRNGMRCYRKP